MKKIIFLIIIIIVIFLIGLKVNYKSNFNIYFGNNKKEKYIYRYNDTRVEDILNDIENNIKINDKFIQNILIKSNNIIIDLNDLYTNKYTIYEIERLLTLIKKYSKEKIIIILRKAIDKKDKFINDWIFKIKNKYDIIIER